MRSGHKDKTDITAVLLPCIIFLYDLTLQPIFLTGINAHLPSEDVECRTLEMTFGKLVKYL